MTFRERFNAAVKFQAGDRIPNVEIGYWQETIERWYNEGFPRDIPFRPSSGPGRHPKEMDEYFGVDSHDIIPTLPIHGGLIPSLTSEVIAETDETKTILYSDGRCVLMKKDSLGFSMDLKHPVTDRETWQKKKNTYDLDMPQRNWATLVRKYRIRDYPIKLELRGFFWTLREWCGLENTLMLFYDDPLWIEEMIEFWTEFLLGIIERVREVQIDCIFIDEDLAGKNGLMFSPEHFKKFLTPGYRRIVDKAHSAGIDTICVDSDGYLDKSVSLFLDSGINSLTPWEVQAGCDILKVAKEYPELIILGGVDKRAPAISKEAVDKELIPKIPELLERGGYIPFMDHLIPPDVPLKNYLYYLEKKSDLLGKYGRK